jgi:FixJ family two-component response regulator
MDTPAAAAPLVFVVDDDASMREALASLIRSAGWAVQVFCHAQAFLDRQPSERPCCLVLDVRMPGLDGLGLQRLLAETGEQLPIIFMTAHGDIPMSVRAMKLGAMEFLPKPFHDQDLLDAIAQALEQDGTRRRLQAESGSIRARYETLTARERDVMRLVVSGLLNKQTAAELDVTEITVKVHRRHLMHKMQAKSLADLVRMAERLNEAGIGSFVTKRFAGGRRLYEGVIDRRGRGA